MYEFYNPNPHDIRTAGDCVVRALCKVFNKGWDTIYDDICLQGKRMKRMPTENVVWGEYLWNRAFSKHFIYCGDCYTVRDFVQEYHRGTYVLGLDGHAVACIDGTYYDTGDCGDENILYFWKKET